MRVSFVTFGCRLNRAESLDLEAQYSAAGWDVVQLPSSDKNEESSEAAIPDVVLVRCCSVTAKAQRDCDRRIARLRERFPNAEILIAGCHPNAKPIPAHLAPEPFTDATVVNRRLSRAYLKVQDGCSGKCAFCIVPSFRGGSVSVPSGQILDKARACIDAGFREIVVTGCNLCLYRDPNYRLPELISAIASLESDGHRVRLGSIEPGLCDTSLLDAMESNSNICRFLHLSLQSGSNRILRLMRRPYTIEQVASFCADARRRFGERLAFGADVITGFPGETDADFSETKSFLSSSHPIPHLHIFPYSERAGTEAATMKPVVPVGLRRARAKELEAISAINHELFARRLTGQEVEVCVELDGNGRTGEYMKCLLKGAARRRSLVRAVVDDYFPKTGSLSATICA